MSALPVAGTPAGPDSSRFEVRAFVEITPTGDPEVFGLGFRTVVDGGLDELVDVLAAVLYDHHPAEELTPDLVPEIIAADVIARGQVDLGLRAEFIAREAANGDESAAEHLARCRKLVRDLTVTREEAS